MARIELDHRKLEACAQSLFREQQAQQLRLRAELGDFPDNRLWRDLSEPDQEQLIEQAYIVLRVWGME